MQRREDLHFGVREYCGADVAALHDNSASSTEGALLKNHPRAEIVVDRDLRSGGGDVLVADAAGDVGSIEQNAIAFELRLQRDAGAIGKIQKRLLFVEGKVVFDGLKGECPIHCTGFEVEEAEVAGEMGGQGAFTCASGTVDGDDGPLAFCLFRLQFVDGMRHSADSPFSGLNLRAGGRFPKGFLLSLNLSKVLTGLPVSAAADLP